MPRDLSLNSAYDAEIVNGDFVVEESTYQHQSLLLLSEKGDFLSSPTTGVGSKRFLESHEPDDFARTIRQEFISDGMDVKTIKINSDLQINVEASYK